MEFFNQVVDSLNLFMGGLSFVIVFSQVLVEKKQQLNYMIISIYIGWGISSVYFSLSMSGRLVKFPHLVGISWPVETMMTAALYLYTKCLFNPLLPIKKKHLLFFLPGILEALVLIPIVYIKSPVEKIYILSVQYNSSDPLFATLIHIRHVVFAVFMLLCIYELKFLGEKGVLQRSKLIRIAFVAANVAIIGIIINVVGLILDSSLLLRVISLVHGSLLLTPFGLGYRYPDFMQNLTHEVIREKYRKSQVNGLNVESILSQLNFLFAKEKIFTDPQLNIEKLGENLNITRHQLSEILNNNLKVSFSQYLSSHRINEAKTLLLDHPDDTILNIAYSVGFNSKSSFNIAFKKFTSLTPSEFRKQNL